MITSLSLTENDRRLPTTVEQEYTVWMNALISWLISEAVSCHQKILLDRGNPQLHQDYQRRDRLFLMISHLTGHQIVHVVGYINSMANRYPIN